MLTLNHSESLQSREWRHFRVDFFEVLFFANLEATDSYNCYLNVFACILENQLPFVFVCLPSLAGQTLCSHYKPLGIVSIA